MDLKSIVEREIKQYAAEGWNVKIIFTSNDAGNEFVLVAHATEQGKRVTYISLHVTLEGDLVIIHEDNNHPTLFETLVEVGVPREKIICVYAGETIPEKA